MATISRLKQIIVLSAMVSLLWSCASQSRRVISDVDSPKADYIKIALLADVHLHDIYATIDGSNIDFTPVDTLGRQMFVRPMAEQLRSTRLFNENYFAFIAALDDIVQRGVSYVILPGDFSDNGQNYNIEGLRNILDSYNKTYGIEFLITTGNHDPVSPYTNSDVSIKFLDSLGGVERINGVDKEDDNNRISPDISYLGYEGIVTQLDGFGFMPQPHYKYWESPFSSYTYRNYSYRVAAQESSLEHRQYNATRGDETMSYPIPDVSYLVEPIDGLWLLAIDANAYQLKEGANADPHNPSNYGSPNNGYSATLAHKRHLIEWIESVGRRAQEGGKRLIAFSHYPAVDFFHGASEEVSQLLGEGRMQQDRNPDIEVAEIFADAGITLHFAGHMHIDDNRMYQSKSGNRLLNVQIPSLAGYYPGYKLLEIIGDDYSIESIPIEDVAGFDALFDLYAMEHEYLRQRGDTTIWNRDILDVSGYGDFLRFHLRELVRLRFIPNDWDGVISTEMLSATGSELLYMSGITEHTDDIYSQFTGFDIIYDLYRIYNGGELAIADITPQRLEEYRSMLDLLRHNIDHITTSQQLIKILHLIECFMQ